VELNDPSQEAGLSGSGEGITWAMGSPFLVTKIGCPVRFTWSSRERQVALNLEIETVSPTLVSSLIIMAVILLWSLTMVNKRTFDQKKGGFRRTLPIEPPDKMEG
jgi:hypothetical protein